MSGCQGNILEKVTLEMEVKAGAGGQGHLKGLPTAVGP